MDGVENWTSRRLKFSGPVGPRARVAASPTSAPAPSHPECPQQLKLYRRAELTSSCLLYGTHAAESDPRSAPPIYRHLPHMPTIPSHLHRHAYELLAWVTCALIAALASDRFIGSLCWPFYTRVSTSSRIAVGEPPLTVHLVILISLSGLTAFSFSSFSPRRTARAATAR